MRALTTYADEDGVCWPSNDTLAEDLNAVPGDGGACDL